MKILTPPRAQVGCCCLAAALCFEGLAQSQPSQTHSRLPRTNLLVFHDRKGEVAAVRTRADWQKRRAEVLRGMEEIMGPLPGKEKRCPLDVKIEQEQDGGSFVRQTITYASEPGSRTPAFLLIPKNTGKRKLPAVLALHPTDMKYGYQVVVEPLRDHYRAYAKDLAENGYVVLAPSYPLLANYQPDLKALGYASGTMKAIWDNKRGLDLLESFSFVDKKRIGAIGHSLGGHNAIFTAVFDERIKVIISSCGFDSFVDYMDGKIKGWTSERYMPGLLPYLDRVDQVPFDFHELIGALAPRAVFVNAPLGDSNFKWRSVDQITASAARIYELYGKPSNLKVEHPDCGHDFPPAIRDQAYEFLKRHLPE